LSNLFGPASYIIRSKLNKRAYPQAESLGKFSIIFTKIPQLAKDPLDGRKVYLNWSGLLYVNDDGGVTTLSLNNISSLTRVLKEACSEGLPLTPPVILYFIMRDSLCVVEELILAAEEEMVALESLSLSRLPSKFLSAVFKMKKETGIIISWLIHLKEVLTQVEAQKVPLHQWGEEDHARFKGLLDRCSYLNDAASNSNHNLSDLIDFYINSSSFLMNKTMKVIAVMTALTIFPAVVGGLLGTNILGNPWDISLAQLVTLVVMAMMATGWTCYRLGWLR
jgi:Mg2+ and Co2+ transporter CorA